MAASTTRIGVLLGGSAVAGLLAAVVVADAAREEPGTAPVVEVDDVEGETVRPVPVVAPSGTGAALAEAVALLSLDGPEGEAIGSLLGTWGAVLADEADEEPPEGGVAVNDERLLGAETGPVFTDPCFDDTGADGCPDPDEVVPAVVVVDPPLGPNAVVVHAFPRPDAELVAECGFSDVADGELPIAVATANPGTIAVTVGSQTFADEALEDEVAEFDAWHVTGELPRPPSSFVAHCLAVPRPTTPGPITVRVVAVDEEGQTATAETVVLASAPGLPGPTITPIDGSMVRVDVPLPETGDAEVFVAPTCTGSPEPITTWRLGSSEVQEAATAAGSAPYLAASPRVRRTTLPLPEGVPSPICIVPQGVEAPPTTLLVTPPDARRLTLAVAEVETPDGIGGPDQELVVLGTFGLVAWTPCAVVLDDLPNGNLEPGPAGVLCTSGGDTGAIAAAGGVLDLAIGVGDGLHVVRIALSATPGGDVLDRYRLPIPAPDLEGTLCTDGVEQPGCVPPEGDAVVGTLTVDAVWDEGPTGPANWVVTQAS